jgi:hypothetical protein
MRAALDAQPVHFELEVLYGTVFQPLCENQDGVDAFDSTDEVEMIDDEALVTCAKCRSALGLLG